MAFEDSNVASEPCSVPESGYHLIGLRVCNWNVPLGYNSIDQG